MIRFITKNSLFYKRQEIWFYNGEKIPLYSNNLFYQAKSLPDNFIIQDKNNFYTSCIDLTLNEDTLFKNIKDRFRTEIRRAEREGCAFEYIEHLIHADFLKYMYLYEKFSKVKKLFPPDRYRMKALFESNNFMFTKVKYAGKEIVTHTYIMDNERVRLINSYHDIAFTDNKLRGYSNKYLHWMDILFFKSKGLSIYDFGGVNEEGYPGVAAFKKSFGGYEEQSFDFTVRKGIYKQFKHIY